MTTNHETAGRRELAEYETEQSTTQTANAWIEGEFFKGEGYAIYARIGKQWFAVNGTRPNVFDIRWEVKDSEKIARLQDLTVQS